MTDIYVKKNFDRRKRPTLLLIVFFLLAAALIGWRVAVVKERKRADQPETSAVEQALTVAEVTVHSEVPETAPALETVNPVSVSSEPRPVGAIPTAEPAEVANLLIQARELKNQQQLLESRNLCFQILESAEGTAAAQNAAKMLDEIHTSLVMDPYMMPEKTQYIVKSGDSLGKIASTYGTTIELLRKSNNIKGDLIRVGDILRVLQGTFRITVDKSDNILTVYLNDRYFKTYRIGTGKYSKTPEGLFTVGDRIVHPPWWRSDGKQVPYGDPENVLGTHWLQLIAREDTALRGYGIHGTWEPETIGKYESAGCVRLLNSDVEELFSLIPSGTEVVIQD